MIQNITKPQALIFDLDGTLWDSRKGIWKTWNMAINNHPGLRGPFGMEELSSYLGLPMDEIARRMFPGTTQEQQNDLMKECCKLENDYLAEHGGVLFDQLEETLAALAKEYQLYIVSNCQCGYIEAFLHAHKLNQYFKDIECWGNTGLFKGESNKLLMKRNDVTNAVYIGDTQGDAQSAIDAGIPFVFCKYGFGSVDHADYEIETFSELKGLFL